MDKHTATAVKTALGGFPLLVKATIMLWTDVLSAFVTLQQ